MIDLLLTLQPSLTIEIGKHPHFIVHVITGFFTITATCKIIILHQNFARSRAAVIQILYLSDFQLNN